MVHCLSSLFLYWW